MSLYFNEATFLSIRDFYRSDEGDTFWPYNFLNEETNVVDRNRNELKLNKKIPVSLLQVWVPLFYIHSFQIPLAQSYSQK